MANDSHIHVRPLEIGDFGFLRDLASKQPNFTVPSVYILWLLLRIKGAICLVGEESSQGPLAYLIAVPVEAPKESLFVWQLAVEGDYGASEEATLAILSKLKNLAHARGIQSIAFSMEPHSAAFRLISRYAHSLVHRRPLLISPLPSGVALNESEYQIDLEY
jgi:hypothetical protein